MKRFGVKEMVYGVVLVVATLAVLQAVTPYVDGIELAALPDWLVPFVEGTQHILHSSYLATSAGFAWSLFGFLRYYYGDEKVNYETDKLIHTWIWFEGMLVIFSAGLPDNYATVLTGAIMALKSVFNQLKEPPAPT